MSRPNGAVNAWNMSGPAAVVVVVFGLPVLAVLAMFAAEIASTLVLLFALAGGAWWYGVIQDAKAKRRREAVRAQTVAPTIERRDVGTVYVCRVVVDGRALDLVAATPAELEREARRVIGSAARLELPR